MPKIFNKLLYISPRDMRKNRSDAVHIMHSCDAFYENGLDVDLLTPRVDRKSYKVEFSEIFGLYNLHPNFNIIEMPTQFLEDKKSNNRKFGFEKLKESIKFALKNRENFKYDLIYSKCFISSLPFLFLKKMGMLKTIFVFEAPYMKNTWLHNFIKNNSDYIVVGTTHMENNLKSKTVNKHKVIRTPLRYYINDEEVNFDKASLRERFNFKNNREYVLYAGKAGVKSKEINYLLEAAKNLPEYEFVIVGITDEVRIKFESYGLPNLMLLPFQKVEDYDDLVRSADVLIANYTNSEYNRLYLGPGKTSSYFKSKNPVIFSDLPTLRERYTDDMVYFLKPDDPDLLTNKIKYVIDNPELNKTKTINAYNHILENSFKKATKKVLEEIERREKEK